MDQTVELYCGSGKPFSRIAEALGSATFSVDPYAANGPILIIAVSEEFAESIPANTDAVSNERVPSFVFAQMFEQLDNYRRSGPAHPEFSGQ